MEMLIFFFLCLFAGILLAFYQERNRILHKGTHPYGKLENAHTIFHRLLKISRHI